MNKLIIAIFPVLFYLPALCQKDHNLTGYPKRYFEKNLTDYIKKNNFQNCTITRTDTSILFSIRDTTVQHVDFYYHFNAAGRCDEEQKLTKCNSCLSNYLDKVLSDSKYEWVKLNPNQWVSKFSKKRMIEIVETNNVCPYIKIKIIKWSRKEYKKLISQT